MDVTQLVQDIEASWFHVVPHDDSPTEEVVFRMDLIFKNAEVMGQFLSKASLQILTNEELHFLNREYHESPRPIIAPEDSNGPH
jgi:hypothetical protein